MVSLAVWIVDDDDAVRDALSLLLSCEGLEVNTCRSAVEFLERAPADGVGCVVLDVHMPGMNGLELQRSLAARGVEAPIIFLTGHGTVPMSADAFRHGAFDFLEKPVQADQLVAAVRAALERAASQREEREHRERLEACVAKLTEREREVMAHVVAGESSKEIARKLGLSHRTVEAHRARIRSKTGARSLPDLVEMAIAGHVVPRER